MIEHPPRARRAAARRLSRRSHGPTASMDAFTVAGAPRALSTARLDADGAPSQAFRTLFLQETISRGLLAPSFVVSYSHTEADVDRTVEIVDAALRPTRAALERRRRAVPPRTAGAAGLPPLTTDDGSRVELVQ